MSMYISKVMVAASLFLFLRYCTGYYTLLPKNLVLFV